MKLNAFLDMKRQKQVSEAERAELHRKALALVESQKKGFKYANGKTIPR